MAKNWMEKARISLAVVASVVGEKINTNQAYVSARIQLLAQREGLFNNAFKALKARLTADQIESCKKRYVALEKPVSVCLTGGAVL